MKYLFQLLLFMLPLLSEGQVKRLEVNDSQKSREITYSAGDGPKKNACPLWFSVTINPTDTLYRFLCLQEIDLDNFLTSSVISNKLKRFEVIGNDGSYIAFSNEEMSNGLVVTTSAKIGTYYLAAQLNLIPSSMKKLQNISGFRINGIGTGVIFRFTNRDKHLYTKIVKLFLKDHPGMLEN